MATLLATSFNNNDRTTTRRNNRNNAPMQNNNGAYNANNNNTNNSNLPPFPRNGPLLSPRSRRNYRRKLLGKTLKNQGKITGYFSRKPRTIRGNQLNRIWEQLGRPRASGNSNNNRLKRWHRRGTRAPRKRMPRISRANNLRREEEIQRNAAEVAALPLLQADAAAAAARRVENEARF
jgi:hypothetical protein